MDETVKNLMFSEIKARRMRLFEEQKKIGRDFTALSHRLREIDREVADCYAAARVFGLDLPPLVVEAVGTTDNDKRTWREKLGLEIKATARVPVEFTKVPDPQKPVIEFGPGPMPRIKDVALDRLKAAADLGLGLKALEIQKYIETTYSKVIHEKTVGMTLYRLSQENPPLVHRQGHTWFFGPASPDRKNPGVDAPGQLSILD